MKEIDDDEICEICWGKITIESISKALECSSRTIYRNMPEELKREKELLNKEL